MLTLNQIKRCGEDFDVFTAVDRKYPERCHGFAQTDEPTLCYKGLDCIFSEKRQFLILRYMNSEICYAGYCNELSFFLMLCTGIAPGGIFNYDPLDED